MEALSTGDWVIDPASFSVYVLVKSVAIDLRFVTSVGGLLNRRGRRILYPLRRTEVDIVDAVNKTSRNGGWTLLFLGQI